MIITYLIGNGFDLNLGLHTRYIDFIDEYVSNTEGDSEGIIDFKSHMQQCIEDQKLGVEPEINWSDAEKAFGQYTELFKDKARPAEIFASRHEDFCIKLSAYLAGEEKKIQMDQLISNDKDLKDFADSLKKYLNGLRPDDVNYAAKKLEGIGNGYKIQFLTFNYTEILDKLVQTVSNKQLLGTRTFGHTNYSNTIEMPIHVHGTTEHGMALGVNDESQLAYDIFDDNEPEYKQQLIKPLFNSAMGESTDAIATNVLNSSDVIYIYGMSLGETDKRWWERIINLMNNKSTVILIIHNLSIPETGLIPTHYTRRVREIRNDFLRYSPIDLSPEQYESISQRIFPKSYNCFEMLKDIAKNQSL